MSPAELIWIVVNVVGLSLTIWAEREANRDAIAAKALNGHIVGIVVRGNVLRERIRIVIQAVFLGIGLYAAATPNPTSLSPVVLALLTVPILLVANSLAELRDRRRIGKKAAAEIAAERDRRMDRLEAQGDQLSIDMAENTRITQLASDNATAAFHEANDLNTKIADHGATLIAQGTLGQDTNDTAHRIDERVP